MSYLITPSVLTGWGFYLGRIWNKKQFLPYTSMLSLTLGQTDEKIIVTLNEKKTLSVGYYLFVFTNITTRDIINKIYNFTDDESVYPLRYNKFAINTNTVFLNQLTGSWRYEVYEQTSAVNTTVTGLTEVERGLLKLNPATEFAFEEYNESTSFKAYKG